MAVRNDNLWHEVEDLDAFRGDDEHATKAWRWLEEMQKDGKIRQIDILRMRHIIEAAYEKGRASVTEH